jgi:hypothetical protein
MSQTKVGSVAEASVNIAAGFAINWSTNMLLLPLFGFTSITPTKAFWYGVLMTLVSFARQYVFRRWFNGLRFGNTQAAQ